MRNLSASFRAFLLAIAALGPSVGLQAGESVRYDDLVGQMLDMERLAVLPAPGEQCAQWSSYDRASQYDAKTGRYVRWDANNDGPQFIRKEGSQYVLAEMEGPGCIWRIWSALAEKGRVKIYIDGAAKPAVDLPFIEYFTGKTAPFAYATLSYSLSQFGSRGHNLYMPIPYQKSCKVVADEGWGRYFQFTYLTYPKDQQVPSFSLEMAARSPAALRRVDDFLANKLGADPAGSRAGEQTIRTTVRADSGKTARVAELRGPRAITALRVKARFKDREDEMAALRKLLLRITWDGDSKPAVWCPLGDFFGTAPGVNYYKSLPTGMTANNFYAYWYMPFADRALVELVNDGHPAPDVQFEIVHAPLARPAASLGRFHAWWHRDTVKLAEDRWPDWQMLQCQGRGRFCGVLLHVWNPRGGWWGEGDEKFFVDGEKFPSTIGTGSEDYFGYAWCDPHLFQRAYHGQNMTQNNRGHQAVFRWHVVDNVPFQKCFEACIEKYYRNSEKGTQYACLPCWYAAPGAKHAYQPVPAAERHGYYTVPELWAGGFKVLNMPRGEVRTQELHRYGDGKWRGDDHLWWTGAKPGAKLDLAVPVPKGGTYEVTAALTKARDYGIVQIYLDGKKAGGPIDLYNPSVIPTEPIPLGTHELAPGEHKLTVEIVGANEKAVPAYMFGLDYLNFRKK